MTTVTLISILATSLILLLISVFLFFSWYQKRQSFRQFEQLLTDIVDQQNARSNKLTRCFIDKRHLDETHAQNLSNQLISAEKLFLQHVINQQIQQQPLDDFYPQLCVLLDSYFNITPNLENTRETAPISSTAIENTDDSVTTQDNTPGTDASSEPEWDVASD